MQILYQIFLLSQLHQLQLRVLYTSSLSIPSCTVVYLTTISPTQRICCY